MTNLQLNILFSQCFKVAAPLYTHQKVFKQCFHLYTYTINNFLKESAIRKTEMTLKWDHSDFLESFETEKDNEEH
jgi:hypothetical protein